MRKYVIENADGVILWVLLIIQELSVQVAKGFFTFKSLKERLAKFPMDLTEFCEQIVKDLNGKNDEDSIKIARKMLRLGKLFLKNHWQFMNCGKP